MAAILRLSARAACQFLFQMPAQVHLCLEHTCGLYYNSAGWTLSTVSGSYCIFWHDQQLQHGLYFETEAQEFPPRMTINEQICPPLFTHKARVNPWYGFQSHSNGDARWDRFQRPTTSASWQIGNGEFRTWVLRSERERSKGSVMLMYIPSRWG